MKNPRLRRTISLLAAGSALTLAAACGGGGSPSTEGAAPSTAQGPVAEPTEPVTITFSSWVGQDKGMKALYAKFKTEHPNITVEFQDVPAEESEKKLTTQVAGGNPPDAAYLDASNIATFAPRKALVDLESYMARSETSKPDDYVPAFRAQATVDGKMYGLPFDGESTGLYYRKDLFEAAGITEPPKTWDEFTAAAQKLTDPAKKQYGFQVFAPEAEYYFYPWLWQNGGELLSADEKTFLMNNDAGKAAADYYVGLAKYSSPDYLNSNSYDARIGFAQGQIGMYMAGSWFAGTLNDEFPKIEDKWATAPLPSGTAGCKTTIAGDALVMFAQGKKQDAAWKWIEFLNEPENMATWTYKSTGTLLPPRTSLLDSPELVQEKPVLKGFADLMKCGVNYNIANKNWPRVTEELNTELGNSMFGKLTPAEALDSTASTFDRLGSR
ncbi:carbohydrate ABC transporter substrate-binding protein, CUT1 family [Microlunatus sagamiharensis]|uniref:Carbohydrate ABC transporter substrate-binding protein, CUT1 family n=1 Tax=Microlunatus sagamiharensis TaxID=546874 RepID=A0A1H2M1L3_9ACTN|nr:sugar ABC transporter substrate-binding protein [Microlunatus sagamiharensis]SDU86982.1 carbohydrate ABC transporter substrate-binding protein, CUT1 family [Microlunatus sagamiharensis]